MKQIGYIHFPRITPPTLTQPPKTHAHPKAITARAVKYKETSRKGQDLRHQKVQMFDGAVLISGTTTYPLPKNTY